MANKLELTWVGKEDVMKVEPRILIENPALGNTEHDKNTENMLIHGDNLLALKSLESKYAGQVKCIYIDPPYNTGSAFEHYDDNLEHSIWLNLMRARIKAIYSLLDANGSLWISINDDERDYLKVLCDEVFGRMNFVCSVIWQKKHTRANDAKWFSDNHDYLLVYAKNKSLWHPNLLPRSDKTNKNYSNPDNDPRGAWASNPCTVKTPSESCIYPIISPSGKEFWPPKGKSWMFTKERYFEYLSDNRIWFGEKGDNAPRNKKFLSEVKNGFVPLTIWPREEVGDNQEAKNEMKALFVSDPFPTPKPERLIERVLMLGSKKGDLILDSFLGSGTTAAVAHKMGRRYIGIEMGDHAYTHCKVRLDKVIAGEDKGGITKSQNWQGGGGYKFYELAPTLVLQDDFGQEIINPAYNAEMLARAIALHEGYTYEPDQSCYFKQARNSEHSYLYVTTRHVNKDIVHAILTQLQENEHLLIVCKSFEANAAEDTKAITIKKIPQSLLDNCEFGKDDYRLNVVNSPVYDDEEDENE